MTPNNLTLEYDKCYRIRGWRGDEYLIHVQDGHDRNWIGCFRIIRLAPPEAGGYCPAGIAIGTKDTTTHISKKHFNLMWKLTNPTI